MSRPLATEQQVQPGEGVAHHHQHHRELARHLVFLGKDTQRPVMGGDHTRDVPGQYESHLESGEHRGVHRQDVGDVDIGEPSPPERVGEPQQRLLTPLHEISQIVSEHVSDDDRDQ